MPTIIWWLSALIMSFFMPVTGSVAMQTTTPLSVCSLDDVGLHEEGYVLIGETPISLLDLKVTDVEVTAVDGAEVVFVIANDHLVGFYPETGELLTLPEYPAVEAADVMFNGDEPILLYTPLEKDHLAEIWANGKVLITLDRPREQIVDFDVQLIIERSLTEVRPAVLGVTQRVVILTTEGVVLTYDLTISESGEVEAEKRFTFDDRVYVLVDILKTGNLNIVYQGQTSVNEPSKSQQAAVVEIDQEKHIPYLQPGQRVYQIYQDYVMYSHPWDNPNVPESRVFYTDVVVKGLIAAGIWSGPGCTSVQ